MNLILSLIRQKIVGKTLDEAREIYKNIRAAKINGKPMILTRDYIADRINVELEEDKIVAVRSLG